MSGNGTGYGGKLVVETLAAGAVCPDLTNVNKRIEIINGQANLIRDNCQNLPPGQVQPLGAVSDTNAATVNVAGADYQLEALLNNSRGQRAENLIGNYAPSMATSVLPSAGYVDGVALGTDYILVAFSQQSPDFTSIGKELIFRLYRKSGVGLSIVREFTYAVESAISLTDLQVLMGAFAFDDKRAVFMFHKASPFSTESLLIVRNGDDIAVADDRVDLGSVFHVHGHPLDSTRYLLSYVPDHLGPLNTVGFRVVSVSGDKLSFGPARILSNPSPQPTGPAILLAASAPGKFEAYSANTNYEYIKQDALGTPKGVGYLAHYSIQVSGTSVVSLSPPELVGDSQVLLGSGLDFVGDSSAALMFFSNPENKFNLGKIIDGLPQFSALLDMARGYYLGVMNLMGAENLHYNGRYYFRLPTSTGTRIFYKESLDSAPKLYNTIFPRKKDFNTSRLFMSGEDLVLIESDYSELLVPLDGHVRVLSTPP